MINIPFSSERVRTLPQGFTTSCSPIGFDEQGNPIYHPNRRVRRSHIYSKLLRRESRKLQRKQTIIGTDANGKRFKKVIIHNLS